MKAYTYIGPYSPTYSKGETADLVKSKEITSFFSFSLPWVKDGQDHYLTIPKGEALYLYGGREALNALLSMNGQVRRYIRVALGNLVMYRAQRRLISGKVKQFIVLTSDTDMKQKLQNVSEKIKEKLRQRKVELPFQADSINTFSLMSIIIGLPVKKEKTT